jgi:hypothetical protein
MIQHVISLACSRLSLLPTAPTLQLKDVYGHELCLSTETKCVTKAKGKQRHLAQPSKLRISKPQQVTQVGVARTSQNNKANLMNSTGF